GIRNLDGNPLCLPILIAAYQEAGLGEFLSDLSAYFRLLSHSILFLLGGNRALPGVALPDKQIQGQPQSDDQSSGDRASGGKRSLVPPHQFLKSVEAARRTGEDRFIVPMSPNVHRQAVGGFVSAR